MLLIEEIRSAASPEGMIVLGIIYFIFWLISKAGGKKKPPRPGSATSPQQTGQLDPSQEEGFSLERILRQIEDVKRQAEEQERQASLPRPKPQLRQSQARLARNPERGPMGRHSRASLPAAEDVEERDTLEGSSLEIEERVENLDNRMRQQVDQDDQAEAVVQRRLQQAAARNREHRNADHKAFDKQIREPAPDQKVERRYSASSMRDAFVWREILGPPKALE